MKIPPLPSGGFCDNTVSTDIQGKTAFWTDSQEYSLNRTLVKSSHPEENEFQKSKVSFKSEL